MTTRDTAWSPGTPCWADLMTTDPAAAREFYGGLFGWEIEVGGEESGGYSMASLGGRSAAGIGPMMGMDGHPPAWNTYLATADADATAVAIEQAGGKLAMPVMDVMDVGRMAFALVPSGGAVGIWQAKSHTGFGVANETGSVAWNEFMTRDFAAAKDFYAQAFGYGYDEMEGMDYAMIQVDGNTVGGIGAMPADAPEHMPPYWRLYFAVDDCDASVAKATELGGSVITDADDAPYGRWATVADPQGAQFCVIKPPAG